MWNEKLLPILERWGAENRNDMACREGRDAVGSKTTLEFFLKCDRVDYLFWLIKRFQKELGISDEILWLLACDFAESCFPFAGDNLAVCKVAV